MKYNEDPFVLCPFYSKEGMNTIVCEGLYEDCSNRMSFIHGKRGFKNRYCKSRYNDCRLCRALMDKYTD